MTKKTKAAVAAAPADVPDPAAGQNESSLAMFVRRLVMRVRKYQPDDAVATQAADFLKRKGLTGSPLREAPDPAAELEVQELYREAQQLGRAAERAACIRCCDEFIAGRQKMMNSADEFETEEFQTQIVAARMIRRRIEHLSAGREGP
jgi:hypothetical protein